MSTNARPWLTAKQLNPLVRSIFVQTTLNPFDGQLTEISSGETPSVVGPRNCGQSAACIIDPQVNKRQRTAPLQPAFDPRASDIGTHFNHITIRLKRQKERRAGNKKN